MLMELVSHMDPLANTSGLLLLVLMNSTQMHAPASLGVGKLLEDIFPHLWARTTSVSQA